ncbi:gp16 family protein [Aeromonas diversa]|uniref:gp16 family protein n=1 Tax=Aeromonas diversa TaxID=502790 RepID=UPI003461D95D
MAPDQRTRLLRLVQVARRTLHLDEESYRALLEASTGKRSAAALSVAELERALQALKILGFVPTAKKQPAGRRTAPLALGVKAPQVAKIRALWSEMARQGIVRDGSETALNHWVERMTARLNGGVGVAEVGWLDAPLAVKVLEALKKWSAR